MSELRHQERDVTVVELLDRLLEHGVVLSGDIRVSVADVDLLEIGIRLLIRTPLEHTDGTRQARIARNSEGNDDLALRLRDYSERKQSSE